MKINGIETKLDSPNCDADDEYIQPYNDELYICEDCEITYTLHVTTQYNHSFQLGKELKSPKAIIAALKKTVFPPRYSEYTNIHFIKHTKTVVSERSNIFYETLL
jgi:hypothetical protein